MIYKAYIKEAGEGCDYTIGCAQTVIDIKATCLTAAIEELEISIIEDYGQFDEGRLCYAVIYEITQTYVMPVEQIYRDKEDSGSEEKIKTEQEAEFSEYERLKSKYESK